MGWTQRIGIGLGLLLSLAACSVEINERLFWIPQDVDFVEDTQEAGTGLFMGRALVEPLALDETFVGHWTTKIEFRLTPGDFIPATVRRETLAYEYGHIDLLNIDREETGPTSPLFVHCYGIGQSLYNNGVQHALKLLPYGDTVQFDLPGHGGSTGKATTQHFDRAVEAMADYVDALPAERPIILWGHSLGGVICSAIASRTARAEALVIEASADDVSRVASSWMPIVARPFIRLKPTPDIAAYQVAELLSGFEGPILVFGAERDDVIPEHLVASLATTLRDEGHLVDYVALSDAGHSTIPFAAEFTDTVSAFLSRLSQ